MSGGIAKYTEQLRSKSNKSPNSAIVLICDGDI